MLTPCSHAKSMAKILDLMQPVSKHQETWNCTGRPPSGDRESATLRRVGEEQCPPVTIFYRYPRKPLEICQWPSQSLVGLGLSRRLSKPFMPRICPVVAFALALALTPLAAGGTSDRAA